MQKYYNQPCILEVTIVSAQGLKKTSSLIYGNVQPFISLRTALSSGGAINGSCEDSKEYITRVDNKGGINPEWGDKFQLPLDSTFFYQRQSSIYLQIYTKHVIKGRSHLGWCQIPAADIVQNLSPSGSVSHLSYRVRNRDGTKGHGVVNVAVKLLQGSLPFVVNSQRPPLVDPFRIVLGIPMTTMNLEQQAWNLSNYRFE